ncbi:MAG: LysR family transcriptional regulator [Clostridia bacterium]|nr:LysR family transcriptional regulator [Clostridia bacterium]
MELLQLHYFFDSAKTESFAKTAEKYMVPPTSVSASVKRLEKELGCSLFDRSCNRIVLNDNGKRLQQSLCVIFEELDSAVNSLSTAASSDKREITLLVRAMRNTITENIIEYKTKNPMIGFKTGFDFSDNDYENYDIIIDDQTNTYQEYEKFELCSLRLRIIASINSPLCEKQLTLKQLYNQHFITFGEQSNLHNILIRSCKRAGFTPNIVIQTNDNMCYKTWIASGLVLGLSRDYPHKRPDGVTQALDIKDFNERQTICVHYKKQSAYGNVKHFLDFLRSKSL